MDCVIDLIDAVYSKDEYGVPKTAESARQVFARVESVTRAEFFGGGRNGLNPEFKFLVFAGDYRGERTIIYKGFRYGIYRTYRGGGDYLELYAERKGGTNGKESQCGPIRG